MTLKVVTPSTPSVTPSAGYQAFGEMVRDIATYYGMDQDPSKEAFIGRIVNDIIDDLNTKKLWRFNLVKAADITTTPGTSLYTMPADLWRVYSMRKGDGVDYTITGLQQATFDTLFQSQSAITGFPYTHVDFNIFRDGTFQLWPTPDGNFTITMRYFKLIQKPADPTASIDMPPPYQNVVKYGALARLGALTGQVDTARLWEAKFQEKYLDMNRADEDMGDENLRFINTEEQFRWNYVAPGARPRWLDFYSWLIPFGLLAMTFGAHVWNAMI